jgi:hypothetical protein
VTASFSMSLHSCIRRNVNMTFDKTLLKFTNKYDV